MSKVRRLSVEDVDVLFPFRLRALATDPLAFCALRSEEEARGPGRLRSSLAEVERFAVFGAFEAAAVEGGDGEGALVGMVGVYREERARRAHRATIWGMFVAPEARGRGLGAALLDAAVGWASSVHGVEQVHLSVASGHLAARALYETRGFVVWGVEPAAMREGALELDEIHMMKRLG